MIFKKYSFFKTRENNELLFSNLMVQKIVVNRLIRLIITAVQRFTINIVKSKSRDVVFDKGVLCVLLVNDLVVSAITRDNFLALGLKRNL